MKTPPHWDGPFAQKPAHDPEWKKMAERVQRERLEKMEEALKMTPEYEKEHWDRFKALMGNADAQEKVKEQAKRTRPSRPVQARKVS